MISVALLALFLISANAQWTTSVTTLNGDWVNASLVTFSPNNKWHLATHQPRGSPSIIISSLDTNFNVINSIEVTPSNGVLGQVNSFITSDNTGSLLITVGGSTLICNIQADSQGSFEITGNGTISENLSNLLIYGPTPKLGVYYLQPVDLTFVVHRIDLTSFEDSTLFTISNEDVESGFVVSGDESYVVISTSSQLVKYSLPDGKIISTFDTEFEGIGRLPNPSTPNLGVTFQENNNISVITWDFEAWTANQVGLISGVQCYLTTSDISVYLTAANENSNITVSRFSYGSNGINDQVSSYPIGYFEGGAPLMASQNADNTGVYYLTYDYDELDEITTWRINYFGFSS